MLNRNHFFNSLFQLANPLPAAVVSAAIYLFIFTLPFLLPQFYATNPPVDFSKLTGHTAGWFLAYGLGILGLFALYFQLFAQLSPTTPMPGRPPIGLKFVAGSALIFGGILIFSYPLTAIDLFIYAIRTRGWALYGLPPLATPPQALPAADPWLGLAGEWVDAPSPYGPVWELLSLGAFYAGGGNYLAHLLLLKLLGLLAFGGCIALVYAALKHLRPAWALAGTLAFAWNPLVLFEGVQNAHNDIWMTLFLLAALWLLSRQATWSRQTVALAALLLALSILVKFVTVLLIPFFLLALLDGKKSWPRRVADAALFAGLLAAVVLLAMTPFWPGRESWAVLRAGGQAGRSLLALLVLALRGSLGVNAAFDVARGVILAAFGLIYLWQVWKSARPLFQPGPTAPAGRLQTQLIGPSFYVLFGYVLLAAPVFHAWYLLWFVPLAPLLLPNLRSHTAAVVFSVTALLVIPYFETVRVWYPALLQNQLLGHIIGVPLLILPPAVALLRPIRPASNSEV